jgi:ribonuclease T2
MPGRTATRRTVTLATVTSTLLAVGLLAATVAPALAQRDDRGRGQGNVAGRFDYYALALSWSPTHCASTDRDPRDPQCERRDGRRYAFVLHGLWPQFADRGWPEYCDVGRRPFVPQPVIDGMLDIMPSGRLVINQYRKHGTCSGMEPTPYFELARQLYGKVRIPPRFQGPDEPQFVSPEDVEREFMRVNPWLRPDAISVQCGGPGDRLREVRICFDRSGVPAACGRNEDQRRLCRATRMFVPPVRPAGPAPRGRERPDTPGRDAPGPDAPGPGAPRAVGRDV